MSPQEIQRMMDFILRSQADAVIRMEQWEEKQEQWEEKYERRLQRIDERLEKVIAVVGETAKISRKTTRESSAARAGARGHEEKITRIERSSRFLKRRSDDMKQLMKLAMRLLAHQSKRLDAMETHS